MMAGEKGRFSKGENACTFEMHCNREETKRECTRGMHCNKEEKEKKMMVRKRKGDSTKGRIHAPLKCVATKRRHRISMPRKEKASTPRGKRKRERWLRKERRFLLRGENMHMFEMRCNRKKKKQWLGGEERDLVKGREHAHP